MKFNRGYYNEISLASLSPRKKKQVENLVAAAAKANKVDKHGSWIFGAAFDSKKRGSALNWDLYGVEKDCFSNRTLIVIQIRRYVKRYRNGFADIKKSYFLIGRNEDNTVFAHPVEWRVVHGAIRGNKEVVRAVQNWIFGQDYARVIRQGDIALLPLRSKKTPSKTEPITNHFVLQGSHEVVAEEVRVNGNLYVKNPSLYHLPKTHPKPGCFFYISISSSINASIVMPPARA
jgi:hypothetical protein